jgi:hypothetical protein
MAGGLAALDLLGRGVKAGAKALDYDIPKNIEPFLTPVSTTKDYLTSKLEEAIGVPKDTIGAVTDPKGFLAGLAKDTAKSYFQDRGEIPEEDRSRPDSSDSGFRDYDTDSMGGGKPFFDNEGMSTSAYKRGGKVKSATKSKVNTASRRGDGIAQRGRTKGRYL